jgi:hypothetical protein
VDLEEDEDVLEEPETKKSKKKKQDEAVCVHVVHQNPILLFFQPASVF